MDAKKILIIFLACLACAAYVYGIIIAINISLEDEVDVSKMPPFLSAVVSNIAGVLAVNLGAQIGNPNSQWKLNKLSAEYVFPSIQVLASYFYVISLLVIFIVWAKKDFTTEGNKIVIVIPELAKSLVGVVAGALIVALGSEQSRLKQKL